jgi:hypothetical protein
MLADRPPAVVALTKIFLDEIELLLLAASSGAPDAERPGASHPRLGGVSFLHRFSSAINHHVHLHACVTDGVFVPPAGHAACDAPPTFLPARSVTAADLAALTERVRRRGSTGITITGCPRHPHRLGRARASTLFTATSFRRRQTKCSQSTSTASDLRRARGINEAAWPPDSERLRADTRNTRLQGGRWPIPEPLSGPGLPRETGARDSRAAHQFGHHCGRADVPLAGLSLNLPIGWRSAPRRTGESGPRSGFDTGYPARPPSAGCRRGHDRTAGY